MLLVLSTVLSNAAEKYLKEIESAQLIHGSKLTAKSLKGKVILFKYWGLNCPPCIAGLPHMQSLQEKYAKTGKLAVIGSHVQGYDKKRIDALLKAKGVSFPVFQQLRLSEAPCGRGIPHKVLIDHQGKVIASGHIPDLDKKVKELVARVPAANPSSVMYDSVEIKHLKREVKYLQLGRPVKNTLTAFERKASTGGEAGAEAGAVVAAVKAWGDKEYQEAVNLKSEAPTLSYQKFEVLHKTFYGMELAARCYKELAVQKRDKYLTWLLNQRRQFDRLKSSKSRSQRSVEYFQKTLKGFIEKYPASEALKKEARSLMDEAGGLI